MSKWIHGYAVTIILKIFTIKVDMQMRSDKVDPRIRGYVVTEYLRIHLFLGVALKWQGILQLSPFLFFFLVLCLLHEKKFFH